MGVGLLVVWEWVGWWYIQCTRVWVGGIGGWYGGGLVE